MQFTNTNSSFLLSRDRILLYSLLQFSKKAKTATTRKLYTELLLSGYTFVEILQTTPSNSLYYLQLYVDNNCHLTVYRKEGYKGGGK